MRKDESDVRFVTTILQTWINPSEIREKDATLVKGCYSSKRCVWYNASPEVKDALLAAISEGDVQFKKFVKERVITQTVSFFDIYRI